MAGITKSQASRQDHDSTANCVSLWKGTTKIRDHIIVFYLVCYKEENKTFGFKTFQTDTASVLHEAITYINFYQEQVKVKCFIYTIKLTKIIIVAYICKHIYP